MKLHVRSYLKYLSFLIVLYNPLMQSKIRLTADVLCEKKVHYLRKAVFVMNQCNLLKWPAKFGVRTSNANKFYETVGGIHVTLYSWSYVKWDNRSVLIKIKGTGDVMQTSLITNLIKVRLEVYDMQS